jgi:hypothetical protein
MHSSLDEHLYEINYIDAVTFLTGDKTRMKTREIFRSLYYE